MVLAAGGGTRWAEGGPGHKLLAEFEGRPLVYWAVEHALEASVGPVWVVTGAVDLASVLPPGVVELPNPSWADGQASSLQRALAEARLTGRSSVVVGLGDQPGIPASAWKAVARTAGHIAVATYDGVRRNPVKLAEPVWELLPTQGDEGARVLMRKRPDLVREVPCQGDPLDVDRREDLETWN